jgi:hypothetical protein
MKTRHGFVSNSSSSCYILDLCDKRTDKVLKQLDKIPNLTNHRASCSRCTAYGLGQDTLDWSAGIDDDEITDFSYTDWINNIANQIGLENTLLVRVSDEDDIQIEIPPDLPIDEVEFH